MERNKAADEMRLAVLKREKSNCKRSTFLSFYCGLFSGQNGAGGEEKSE